MVRVRDAAAKLEAVTSQLPGGLWTTDRDLRFVSASGKNLDLIGLDPQDLVGSTLFDVLGTEDPEHPAVLAHGRALAGEPAFYEDHFLGRDYDFEVLYHLYSVQKNHRLRLKVRLRENDTVDSVTPVWPGANWPEREAYDLVGVRFHGHPDLRRILMWEGYPYHPLRKEFPLAGLPVDSVVRPAPMAGGPFVTSPGEKTTVDREPRAKGETDSVV
jgi:NADH:ubiquinone oxidoreductase subunit C